MNKMICGLGAVGLIFAAGCRVELADGAPGQDEAYWGDQVKKSFPSHSTARVMPPAVKDRYSPDYQPLAEPSRPAEKSVSPETPAPADDPGSAVDRAAEGSAEKPEITETTAAGTPAAEEAKADTKVQNGDAKAAGEKPAASDAAIEPPDPTGSEIYVVQSGDTLGAIAQRFYGDSRRKDIIIRANLDVVSDPDRIRPGMKLMIPKL